MWAAPAVADPIAALASKSQANVDSAKGLLEQAKRLAGTPTPSNDGPPPPKTIFEVAKPGASPSPRAASIMSVIAGAAPAATKAASVSDADDGELSERSTSSSSRQERMARIAAQMAQAPAHG